MKNKARLTIDRDDAGHIVAINAEFPVAIIQKGAAWVAYAPDLNTFGYSRIDANEARRDLDSAIHTFFSVHRRRGTLEQALENFHWRKADHSMVGAKRFNMSNARLGVQSVENRVYASARA